MYNKFGEKLQCGDVVLEAKTIDCMFDLLRSKS